jgi:protein gp37
MSQESSIEWTDATWNPTTGCTKISPGCANCYIERTPPFRMAGRKFENGKIPLVLHEDRLDTPLGWKKPKMVFVNSLSDLFHKDVPLRLIAKVMGVVAYCRRHTFQVLTKRAERMLEVMTKLTLEDCLNQAGLAPDFLPSWPPENLWLGVSIENKKHGWPRVCHLRNTPAAVRFFSCEPLLEDVTPLCLDGIHWVIVGGESGTGGGIRPMHPDWPGSIRDQCVNAGVPFFFKQWGEWAPWESRHSVRGVKYISARDGKVSDMESAVRIPNGTSTYTVETRCDMQPIVKVGKKAAGRLLDGREWNEMPNRKAVPA